MFPKIEQIIIPRVSDIGNFEVMRALPSKEMQMVGPFIFWDQMGPGEFLTGQGIDVRPHPHIGLSTLTYLFEGSLDHRDSLGSYQRIIPGEANLMSAGKGIVHSERTGKDIREKPHRLFGIQSWLALPKEKEEMSPAFSNFSKDDLPELNGEGKFVKLIAGEFLGLSSPVKTASPTIFADIILEKEAKLPVSKTYEERALYPIYGEVEIGGVIHKPNQLLILKPGDEITITAKSKTRLMLLGGDAMDGERYLWWNFVSSSKERIEQAKQDWLNNKFPPVPNDTEFIPLPKF
jgi:redox-sensitive bicupin YhaK (pirin superfamily)